MSFVQTIWFSTARIDEMMEIMKGPDEGSDPDEPMAGFLGMKLLKDRDNENRYLAVVEFENYDLAMANSEREETDAFAQKMAALCDDGPHFGNFDTLLEQDD